MVPINPVPIIDKNGKRTTVHKKFGSDVDSARLVVPSPPQSARLIEDEWRHYGFKAPSAPRIYTDFANDSFEKSEREIAQLSVGQQNALSFFTSQHNYRWLNQALFNGGELRETDESAASYISVSELSREQTNDRDVIASQSLLKDITKNMDDAFVAVAPMTRFLYRGVDSTALFDDSADEYVAQSYELGTEFVIDGYQSASADPSIGVKYANKSGVVLEMKTNSGIATAALSHYQLEDEVILPRSTRWRVVGVHTDQDFTIQFKRGSSSNKVTLVQLVEIDADGEESTGAVYPPALSERQLGIEA